MTSTVTTHPISAQPWRDHCLGLGAVLLLIVLEFHEALIAAFRVWVSSPTYSHCFLVLPIVAWLIWEKRGDLAIIRPTVAPSVLWFVPVLLAAWWVGQLSAINEVRQFAVIGMVQVMIIAMLGVDVARALWFPMVFLLFLVPTGEYLIFPMQQFATRFVDVCLSLLHVPHYTEGTTFELTNGRFEIAEACAGLRFLIATVTLGVLFSYLVFQKVYKVVLFLVASVLVPLIGNGIRCVGIILIAHYTNNEYGAGADHVVYGWGFNVAILLILMFLGSLFRDDTHENARRSPSKNKLDESWRVALVAVIAAMLVSAGPAFASWHDSRTSGMDASAIPSYLHERGWRNKTVADGWSPVFPGADIELEVTESVAPGPPVDLFVGYYARPRPGHSVTAHVNLAWDEKVWNASSTDLVHGSLAGHAIPLQEVLINSGGQKRLIWSAYWVAGGFALSPIAVKLLQAEASFKGHEGQAFVALSTPVDGTLDDARLRLSQGLSTLDHLSESLGRASVASSPVPDGAQ